MGIQQGRGRLEEGWVKGGRKGVAEGRGRQEGGWGKGGRNGGSGRERTVR